MAEDKKNEVEGTGEEGAEGSAKSGSSKLIIIIVLAVILICGAAAGAFFMLSGGDEGEHHEEAAVETPKEHGAPKAAAHGAAPAEGGHGAAAGTPSTFFFELPEILVNLASTGSATRYLKLKLNLEVGSEADLAQLQMLMPRVVDDFQLYLRQLRVEDLNGSSGIYRLKEDLLLRANQAVAPLQVNNVLFKEILVQ